MAAKSDTVVKLVIVLFISLLSFSVGLFAGKNFSDNQHTISQLEPTKTATREVASEHGATATESKSGAMTDEEIAKLAEEFVADEKPVAAGHGEAAAGHGEAAPAAGHGETAKNTEAPAHGAPAKTETAKHGEAPAAAAGHGEKAEPSNVAKELAAGKAPQTRTAPAAKPATAESRIPSSLPQNVAQYTVGKFTVQVASYADEAEAQKFASDLKTKGYSAFYVPANIKGKTWYRVSVGQFATSKEAASYRTELISKAKVSSAIVQKITE